MSGKLSVMLTDPWDTATIHLTEINDFIAKYSYKGSGF